MIIIRLEEFLEYAKVFNNYYGTTRTPVIDNLNKGKNVLFDIDWQGADQLKNKTFIVPTPCIFSAFCTFNFQLVELVLQFIKKCRARNLSKAF